MSLSASLDAYANDENQPPIDNEVVNRMRAENLVLKNRITMLNKLVYDLRAEQSQLKTAVASYAGNVQNDHNYNINI